MNSLIAPLSSFALAEICFLNPNIELYSAVDITLLIRDIKLMQLETSVSLRPPQVV